MKKPLFTTSVAVTQNAEKTKSSLMDLASVLKRNEEIISVERIDERLYKILRKEPALNREELISLEESESTIGYHIVGDVAGYSMEF